MVDESLYFFKKDVGKKVYEIEYEATYITKWQVIANDENEAFNIWLAENAIIKEITATTTGVLIGKANDFFAEENGKIQLSINLEEIIILHQLTI